MDGQQETREGSIHCKAIKIYNKQEFFGVGWWCAYEKGGVRKEAAFIIQDKQQEREGINRRQVLLMLGKGDKREKGGRLPVVFLFFLSPFHQSIHPPKQEGKGREGKRDRPTRTNTQTKRKQEKQEKRSMHVVVLSLSSLFFPIPLLCLLSFFPAMYTSPLSHTHSLLFLNHPPAFEPVQIPQESLAFPRIFLQRLFPLLLSHGILLIVVVGVGWWWWWWERGVSS